MRDSISGVERGTDSDIRQPSVNEDGPVIVEEETRRRSREYRQLYGRRIGEREGYLVNERLIREFVSLERGIPRVEGEVYNNIVKGWMK